MRAAFGIACAFAVACGTATVVSTSTKPPPVALVDASAPDAATDSGIATAPQPTMPVYALEPFAPDGGAPTAVFAIEGATMVIDDLRVGRIAGEGIDWVGKIPKRTAPWGDNVLVAVDGRYPDSVGVIFQNTNGRASSPTWTAITGKGIDHMEAGGGGWGSILPARVGEAVVLATQSGMEGTHLITVRGHLTRRFIEATAGGCKATEVRASYSPLDIVPAVAPSALESSPAGTLMSLGTLCQERGPAAEIWDKTSGKSRIVDLTPFWKSIGYSAALLRGSGDELWAFGGAFQPILHWTGEKFTALPELGTPIALAFASPTGELYVDDGNDTIHRFEGERWVTVGHIADATELRRLVVDADGTFWASASSKVRRLRETSRAPIASECTTWFVQLYQASSRNSPGGYTYPTTRKALSTFPEVADLGLVEYGGWPMYVGVTVKSKAQGEAVIAHVQATMKDESPRLYCYVPKTPRRIPIDTK